jgi:hypothetical protein
VRAQNVVTGIEDNLRGELKAALDGPRIAEASGEPSALLLSQLGEPRDDLFQP